MKNYIMIDLLFVKVMTVHAEQPLKTTSTSNDKQDRVWNIDTFSLVLAPATKARKKRNAYYIM